MNTLFGFDPDGLRRYLASSLALFSSRLFQAIAALLTSVLIARHLGTTGFGEFSFAQSIASIIGVLATLGLEPIIIRELVRHPEDRNKLLGTAIALRAFTVSTALIVFMLSLHLAGLLKETKWLVAVILLGGHFFQTATVVEFYFRAGVQSSKAVTAHLASSVGLLLFVAVAAIFEAGILTYAFGVVLSNLILATALAFSYQREHALRQLGISAKWASRLLRDSWPILLAYSIVYVYEHIDKIMINVILGNAPTGEYSAAARISSGIHFIPTVITASVFPAIVRARSNDSSHYYKRLQNLFDLMVWSAILIAIPVSLFAEEIMAFIFGADFGNSHPVLTIQIWSGTLVFLGIASGQWFIAEGMTKHYFVRTTMGVGANLMLNLVFIPRYGIIGAAYATVLSQFIVVIVADACFSSTRHVLKMKIMSFVPLHLLKFS